MIRIRDLIARVSDYHSSAAGVAGLERAYVYAATLYRDQFLEGGAPLLQHALEVGEILTELRLDVDSICAGLLHEALVKSLAEPVAMRDVVGSSVVSLLQELAKLEKATYRGSESSRSEHMRQMILSTTRDVRVILILLADRLQTLRKLEQFPAADREAIARETLHIYGPIAHRLGIYFFLAELEDLAFTALEPKIARELQTAVESRINARRERIAAINEELRELLAENGVVAEVTGRTKHLYSIHNKLKRQQTGLDDIFDLLATRVIVHNTDECYRVLGLIHARYTPMPGRFKDYIAIPKANGYQSLHTSCFGGQGEIVEMQIRTQEMHRSSELGIAAHFKYKDSPGKEASGGAAPDQRELAHLAWFRNLLDSMEAGADPGESMEFLRRELHPEEVFVFTPAGEVIKLPTGATVIDFAFAIHSDVGKRCTGARIDGQIAPIRTPLATGTVVEIITANRGEPREDWLHYAVTSKALSKIRSHLRQRKRDQDIERGRERVIRELKRIGHKVESVFADGDLQPWLWRHSLQIVEDLYAAEGAGQPLLQELIEKLAPHQPKPVATTVAPTAPLDNRKLPPGARVRISGMRNVEVRFARCCSPQVGEPLAAMVTRGHAISVHHAHCGNLRRVRNREARLLDAEWITEHSGQDLIQLVVSTESSREGLAKVARLLEAEGTPIESEEVRSEHGRFTQRITVGVSNARQTRRILQRLNAMEGIRAVREVASAGSSAIHSFRTS